MRTLAAAVFFTALAGAQVENRSFRGVQTLLVENVNGPLEIVGVRGGDAVELQATREVRADDPQDRARADQEVRLVAEEYDGKVHIYIDYPQNSHHRHYDVRYSMVVRVPSSVKLDGRTVNGGVKAHFAANPSQPLNLQTVNGSVDATFQPGLAADVHGDTLNGGVYTDFDPTPLATTAKVEKIGNMTRYRTRGTAFRLGSGGPEFGFKTINGSIFIRSEKK